MAKAQPFAELARYIRFGILVRMPYEAISTLLVLVAHANVEGKSWPSASTISLLTGRKRENVYRDLQAIQKLGIFDRTGRHKGKGATIFRLLPFDENRMRGLLSGVSVSGRAKKGDARRFGVPITGTSKSPAAVPMTRSSCPYDSGEGVPVTGGLGVPVLGTEKGIRKGEKKGVLERGGPRGAAPPAPPAVRSRSQGEERPRQGRGGFRPIGAVRAINGGEGTVTRDEKIDAVARYLAQAKPDEWELLLRAVPTDRYPEDVIETGKARALALREGAP